MVLLQPEQNDLNICLVYETQCDIYVVYENLMRTRQFTRPVIHTFIQFIYLFHFANKLHVVVWVIVRVCSVVLTRTVVGVDWRFDNLSGSHHHSDDGFRSGCRNVSQHQQQSLSGLHYKLERSLKPQHWLTWVQTFHCYKIITCIWKQQI